jgi:hypothetical protein
MRPVCRRTRVNLAPVERRAALRQAPCHGPAAACGSLEFDRPTPPVLILRSIGPQDSACWPRLSCCFEPSGCSVVDTEPSRSRMWRCVSNWRFSNETSTGVSDSFPSVTSTSTPPGRPPHLGLQLFLELRGFVWNGKQHRGEPRPRDMFERPCSSLATTPARRGSSFRRTREHCPDSSRAPSPYSRRIRSGP